MANGNKYIQKEDVACYYIGQVDSPLPSSEITVAVELTNGEIYTIGDNYFMHSALEHKLDFESDLDAGRGRVYGDQLLSEPPKPLKNPFGRSKGEIEARFDAVCESGKKGSSLSQLNYGNGEVYCDGPFFSEEETIEETSLSVHYTNDDSTDTYPLKDSKLSSEDLAKIHKKLNFNYQHTIKAHQNNDRPNLDDEVEITKGAKCIVTVQEENGNPKEVNAITQVCDDNLVRGFKLEDGSILKPDDASFKDWEQTGPLTRIENTNPLSEPNPGMSSSNNENNNNINP